MLFKKQVNFLGKSPLSPSVNCHFFCCPLHWDVRCEGLPSSSVSLSTELDWMPLVLHTSSPRWAFAQEHCGASGVGIWSVCTETRSCRSIAQFCWLWALPVSVCVLGSPDSLAVELCPPLPAVVQAPVFGPSLSSLDCYCTLLEIQHSSIGWVMNVIAFTVLQAE